MLLGRSAAFGGGLNVSPGSDGSHEGPPWQHRKVLGPGGEGGRFGENSGAPGFHQGPK